MFSTVQDKKYFNVYNGDLILQYKFSPNKFIYKNEIENYINLLWLRMFCMTFHYCDSKEKNLRFYEMLKVLKSTIYLKDYILSTILVVLEEYGEEYMLIKFFELLSDSFCYTDYAYLINRFINKSKIKTSSLKKFTISNTGINLFYYKNNKEHSIIIPEITDKDFNEIHPRTFSWNNTKGGYIISDNESVNEIETVRFDDNLTCPKCKKEIDLAKLTLNFKKMNKEQKFTCLNCKNQIEIITNVRIGKFSLKIDLYQPYYLYNNYSTMIMLKHGFKLDLNSLREDYRSFLWNCVWYFSLHNLSYDMMFKYKDEEESKKIKEVNKQNSEKIENKSKKSSFRNTVIEKQMTYM